MAEPTVVLSTDIAEALRACPPLARYATPWHMAAHAADVVRALLPKSVVGRLTLVDQVAQYEARAAVESHSH